MKLTDIQTEDKSPRATRNTTTSRLAIDQTEAINLKVLATRDDLRIVMSAPRTLGTRENLHIYISSSYLLGPEKIRPSLQRLLILLLSRGSVGTSEDSEIAFPINNIPSGLSAHSPQQ